MKFVWWDTKKVNQNMRPKKNKNNINNFFILFLIFYFISHSFTVLLKKTEIIVYALCMHQSKCLLVDFKVYDLFSFAHIFSLKVYRQIFGLLQHQCLTSPF